MVKILLVVAATALAFMTAAAQAQVSQVTYYAPAPVTVAPVAPSVFYPPVRTTYYAPATAFAPATTFAPAATFAPATTTAFYAPAPVTTFYAPAPVVAAPVPVTTTYYRPLIGGTITRTRYINPAMPVAAPVTTFYAPY